MSKQTKILYLITQSEWGGAQRYIFDLATNISHDGYEITVAAGKNKRNNGLFTKLDGKNIKSYTLKNLVREINPIKDIKAYFEIKKLLREINPDILHLNSSKAGFIGALAGKHIGIKKIIYTVHGFVFNEPLPIWKKIIYLFAEKYSAKYKDSLICVSEFDRQTGIQNKIAKKEKLITINNSIEPINFLEKAKAIEKLNLPKDKIIIGTIANFYSTKGLKYLTQAAKMICKAHPELNFVIIGDGDLKNDLKKEISLANLEKCFILPGKIDQAYKYLKAFDYYVSPSVKEGFPYSILEAMQAGLPIVSTKVGGIPEMIKDEISGLLVKPADPADLSKAINNILENKNLADKLSSQAKIDVINKFNLEIMIEKTKKLYR